MPSIIYLHLSYYILPGKNIFPLMEQITAFIVRMDVFKFKTQLWTFLSLGRCAPTGFIEIPSLKRQQA